MKFTPRRGSIRIEIAGSSDTEVLVAIRDSGVGIPKKDLAKLFKVEEKYTRLGLAGEKGTGLGLPLCAELMKQHGGSIRVESEVEKGTTFILSFPAVTGGGRADVLIVDNEKGDRSLHARYVKRVLPDATILETSDGDKALHLPQRYRPRLIISDYSMPKMSGVQFLKALRQDIRARDIPVLIVTGYGSGAVREALIDAGATGIMSKPVPAAQFQEAVKKTLSVN